MGRGCGDAGRAPNSFDGPVIIGTADWWVVSGALLQRSDWPRLVAKTDLRQIIEHAKDQPKKLIGAVAPIIKSKLWQAKPDQDAAARAVRLRELRWKNSAWLATADTIAGWNGFEIRNAGSGRSPVRKRSG